MTKWVDVNVFVGRYPFRRLASSSAERCVSRLRSVGFSMALASSMSAVFEEDSYAAEVELADELAAHPQLLHLKTVNPALSWWRRDAERAVRELGVRGLRLCCPYHGYTLSDPAVRDVLCFAVETGLPVQILCRMQDYRLQWMLFGRDADGTEARALLESLPDDISAVLCGLHFGEILALADVVRDHPRVLFDTSRLRGPWRTFEKLVDVIAPEQLTFGSMWPINLPECPLEQVRHADISDDARSAILGGNVCRLLCLDEDG